MPLETAKPRRTHRRWWDGVEAKEPIPRPDIRWATFDRQHPSVSGQISPARKTEEPTEKPVDLSQRAREVPEAQRPIPWVPIVIAIVFVVIIVSALNDYSAHAAGRTTHHETRLEHQRNEPVYLSTNNDSTGTNGSLIVRKARQGVVCPTHLSAVAPWLDGVQTDSACLRSAPEMRR